MSQRTHILLIWVVFAFAVLIPLVLSAMSPQLAWRRPAYIMAGFAGVLSLCLLLVQPLLAGKYLPGLSPIRYRRLHAWMGTVLVIAVTAHIVGLWITSRPDVIDALLLRSPTPFSIWGVIAMWAIFAAAMVAIFKNRLPVKPPVWRFIHTLFALIAIIATIVHALKIEGTMEVISKWVLCFLVLAAAMKLIVDLKIWHLQKSTVQRQKTGN